MKYVILTRISQFLGRKNELFLKRGKMKTLRKTYRKTPFLIPGTKSEKNNKKWI